MRFSQMKGWLFIALQAGMPLQQAMGYDLDPMDKNSIETISQKVAYKMMKYYPGNKTGGIPGIFGEPIFWWQSGAIFGGLVDYWFYTGDREYLNETQEAIMFQVGDDENFMPVNQTHTLGNDDQCFWALTAMSAAEKKFPDPPKDKPQWVALVQAVFNTQVERWAMDTCNGGLRWQIFEFNDGYTYKNTVSNACFMHIAARLARYTGNDTYALWAEKAYDWMIGVSLVNSTDWAVYDGHPTGTNCSITTPGLDRTRWSYNFSMIMAASAYLYNYTNGAEKWKNSIDHLLNSSEYFYTPKGFTNTSYEPACEPKDKCDYDQKSFKAYLARFMALTVKMAPYTTDFIMPKLRTSAIAAAKHCSGGDDGNNCGMKWTLNGTWDGLWSVSLQLSALETIQSNLILGVEPAVTFKTGGTSQGNPAAGGKKTIVYYDRQIVLGDRVGAGILTAVFLIAFLGVTTWLVMV